MSIAPDKKEYNTFEKHTLAEQREEYECVRALAVKVGCIMPSFEARGSTVMYDIVYSVEDYMRDMSPEAYARNLAQYAECVRRGLLLSELIVWV